MHIAVFSGILHLLVVLVVTESPRYNILVDSVMSVADRVNNLLLGVIFRVDCYWLL